MAFKSIDNINLINANVQYAKSDKIVFRYGLDFISKILTDTAFEIIIQKIKKEGFLDKKEAIRLYKIIDSKLDKIIQKIRDYCKKNHIDLDAYINSFFGYRLDGICKFTNDYLSQKIFNIFQILIFIFNQDKKKHINFIRKFFDVEVVYALGNFLKKDIDAKYLNECFWEILSYIESLNQKNEAFLSALKDNVNSFKKSPDNIISNKSRKRIIKIALDFIPRKGSDHFLFISKYVEIKSEFKLLNFKEPEEFSLYKKEIEKIKKTLKTKVWYNLDILIWLSKAYQEGDHFIDNNIEEIDLMPIYYPMLLGLCKLSWKKDECDQSLLENKIGLNIEDFKYVLNSVAMYINEHIEDKNYVLPNNHDKELFFDETTGILFLKEGKVDFSSAPLEIEFLGLFFPGGSPLKSEKGLSRFDIYKDLYVSEKDKKYIKPESIASDEYNKVYALKRSIISKIEQKTLRKNFFITKNKYINFYE